MIKKVFPMFTDRATLVSLLLGFSSGLPLALSGAMLQAWYASSEVSLVAIGFIGFISLPYTLKFCWAPFLDRFSLPGFGRRKGWIFTFQCLLALTIVIMSFFSPQHEPIVLMILAGFLAFFSASQDIAVDAYRIEILTPTQRALGAAMAVNGYRIAMLVSGGVGLILADYFGFKATYLVMALLVGVGAIATFIGPEEPKSVAEAPRRLQDCLVLPLIDFFSRPQAIWILVWIVAYKLGDAFAGSLFSTFLIRAIHMSLSEIGILVKSLGFLGTVIGTTLGGFYVPKLGWCRSLLVFGIIQAVANVSYIPLLWIGPNYTLAGVAIFLDNMSSGMSTAAFVGFIMGLCNTRFTAFQYALLSALSAVGRVLISPIAGLIAEHLGWEAYFIVSLLVSIPGLILLGMLKLNRYNIVPNPI